MVSGMWTFASLRKRLEKTKAELEELQRQKAEREAREQASEIFKEPQPASDQSLFEDRSSLFADRGWLQPTRDPSDSFPVGRETYVNALAKLLTPALSGGGGRNVYVVGPPGTGKTLTVRYVLAKLTEHARNTGITVHVAYVNAGRTRTPYFTFLDICRSIGVNAPPSGWQFTRLKEEFEKNRGDEAMVVAIDEADALILKVREPLIYYLNRQPKVTMLLITNWWDNLVGLPARARSTLQLAPLIFKPYTLEEAKRILQPRAARAFKAGAVDEEILGKAAGFAAEAEDIRVGFNVLLTAGMLAEAQGRSRLDLVDLERAEAAIRPTL